MTNLAAHYTFSSGDTVGVNLDLENDYPDCLAEAVKTLGSAMSAVLTSVSLMEDDDEED